MMDAELLEKVKIGLGITGGALNATLLLYIEEVKNYMLDAGVRQEVIDSSASVGIITRGVADLWSYGAGSASLSEYFRQRVIQLAYKVIDNV